MKPIDWTRPLRTALGARIKEWKANGSGHIWVTAECGRSWPVTRDGYHKNFAGEREYMVENVPAEPHIVERFTVVQLRSDGDYYPINRDPLDRDREGAEKRRASIKGPYFYVARVLIEEPGDE